MSKNRKKQDREQYSRRDASRSAHAKRRTQDRNARRRVKYATTGKG